MRQCLYRHLSFLTTYIGLYPPLRATHVVVFVFVVRSYLGVDMSL
jgi:hypothetical protein